MMTEKILNKINKLILFILFVFFIINLMFYFFVADTNLYKILSDSNISIIRNIDFLIIVLYAIWLIIKLVKNKKIEIIILTMLLFFNGIEVLLLQFFSNYHFNFLINCSNFGIVGILILGLYLMLQVKTDAPGPRRGFPRDTSNKPK